MLAESRRTYLFQNCPVCGGKIFRNILEGSYQSEEYGTTSGLKVWDRCEECKEVFGETDVVLDTSGIKEQVNLLFDTWEQRKLTDQDFADEIQKLFAADGGWISKPCQNTG